MHRTRSIVILICLLSFNMVSHAGDRSSLFYTRGAKLASEGDINGAIELFRKSITESPMYCLGHYGIGRAFLYKKDMIGEGVRHLRRSVELDRRFAKGYFYLGMGYLLLKKYNLAARAFLDSYENDSRIVEALYNLSIIYDITGRKYYAMVYYRKYRHELERKGGGSLF